VGSSAAGAASLPRRPTAIAGRLILHGRYVCKARKPDCPACVIADICKAAVKTTSIPAPLVEVAPLGPVEPV
jgi:endonuclease-3